MKKVTPKIFLLITTLSVGINVLTIEANAADISQKANYPANTIMIQGNIIESKIAVPFADIIGWRYKSENGNVYRRQYNYSQEKWIGEWELC